jgi:protein-S-isoprenylcysteine O-methyltransferase
MTVYPPEIIGPIWGASELFLTLARRSKPDSTPRDSYSLWAIWLVTLVAIALAIVAAYRIPSCRMPWPKLLVGLSACVFGMGLALRWYSIMYLGRFFTVNVAIAKGHELVDSGPYRFVRHPSYAGFLIISFGFGLSFENLASLLVIFLPACAVILWRIHVEERALLDALGERYRSYMRRTRRLIPLVF